MFVRMKDAGTNKGAVCVSENSCIIQVLGKESNKKKEFKTFSCLQPVTGILLIIHVLALQRQQTSLQFQNCCPME